MIIGDKRESVIENIRRAAGAADFQAKVEVNDPVLTASESKQIIEKYEKNKNKAIFKLKALAARRLADAAGSILNKDTEIVGLEKLDRISGGAIITSNHFSPLDNTIIRKLTRRLGKKRVNIVSQITNFAMRGAIGFLMNYADTIPLADDFRYISRALTENLRSLLERGELVLIYPEREMWFNYRKPRPGMRGAYYFAAKLNAPIISCFIEMRDTNEMDTEKFYKVKYVLHVLSVLYPNPQKNVRENSVELMERDYRLKREAYERVYGKSLDYNFEISDIAGWIGR